MSKRREFKAEFKLETMLEALRREKSISQICRERDITDSLYYKWREAFWAAAPEIFAEKHGHENDEKAQRIAELERMVGA